MDSGGKKGDSSSGKRPIIRDGVLHWVTPQSGIPSSPVVAFSGRGHRIDQTHGDSNGPLSHQNIGFLRSLADRQNPLYVGMRHTTDDFDRQQSANNNRTLQPGFHGDAYSLVPMTTFDRNMQRFARSHGGLRPTGFSGNDHEFNSAVEQGIRNSVDRDLGMAPVGTVRQTVRHIGNSTQFALANMGRAPGARTDSTYGSSTPSFGKTHVNPDQVLAQVSVTSDQLLSGLPSQVQTYRRIDRNNHFEVRETLVNAYGRGINSALDQMRPITPSNDSPQQRRERTAAAAELRMLQSQSRGRPSVREQHQERMQNLQHVVREPTRND